MASLTLIPSDCCSFPLGICYAIACRALDETWTATNMTRSHGRCRKGERLRMGFPHGHRKTTTLVAGLRTNGMVAPMVLDGQINGDCFEAYVAQVLVPELRPGDVVIMD